MIRRRPINRENTNNPNRPRHPDEGRYEDVPQTQSSDGVGRTREVLIQGGKNITRYVQLGSKRVPYRSLIITFEILGGIVFVGFIAVLIAHMRLSQGPVSLQFLVDPIEQAINQEMPGSQIRIGNAVVQYDDKSSVRFRLQNVSLFDSKGDRVAQAPRAAIRLSGAALLRGRIAPAIVEFIEPRILLYYSEDKGLSLSFPTEEATSLPDGSSETLVLPSGSDNASEVARPREVSLSRSVGDALEHARRNSSASSFLTRFGLRDARVVFEREGRQSFWQVPYFEINMEHLKKRSYIEGGGRIVSSNVDWGLDFRIVEFARKDRIEIETVVSDLIPSKLQKNLPYVSFIEGITTPVRATVKMKTSRKWDLRDANVALALGRGAFGLPGFKRPPRIEKALLNFSYSAADDLIQLNESTVRWDDSVATVSGLAKPLLENGLRAWGLSLNARDVQLGLSNDPLPLEGWQFNGRYIPEAHYLEIGNFQVKQNGASIALQGHLAKRKPVPDIELTGTIDPMPFLQLKKLWPAFLLPDAYDWFQDSIYGGDVTRGVLNISTRQVAAEMAEAGHQTAPVAGSGTPDWLRRIIRFELDGENVDVEYLKDMPYVKTGAAKLLISGQSVIVRVADGMIELPSGREVALKEGEFRINDFFPDVPRGQVLFGVEADALSTLELLDHKPLGYVSRVGFTTNAISGHVKGNIHLDLPLYKDVQFGDVKIDGRLNLEDGVLKQEFGGIKVNGGSISFGVTEKALEASGDVLLAGVPAKLHWQRIFSASPGKQPPIRIRTKLDDSDRDQLGLEVNHVVQGLLPVVMTIGLGKDGKQLVSAQADLTNAELILENMAWRKPPGHTAILEFDIVPRAGGRTELQNFKIVGDNIAIDGWLSLNTKNRLDKFYFPEFSVNLISHLEIEGALSKENIWKVKARGTTFDGRNLFRSLFSAGRITDKNLVRPKDRQGIDLNAEIANLVGFEDTMLKDVKVTMSRRRGKMSALSARGVFDDGKPINVNLVQEKGKPRYLLSETKNAGNAFRLIGFYPSVIGGTGSLKVNMDGEGYAEKVGRLWARDFYIRGDPVVGQVLVNTPDDDAYLPGGASKKGGRKVKYSKTQFDRLNMSFLVGEGQLVLNDSYINGPLIGATIRGRVDYERKRIDLDGTYVPLYGLNSVAGEIPIFGPIFRGRRGEGLFGIKFQVLGSMASPNVIVNPISVITPGFLRQIFDTKGSNIKVRPRRRPTPPPGNRGGARSSSAPAISALPPAPRSGPPPPPVPARKPKMPGPESWAAETFAN